MRYSSHMLPQESAEPGSPAGSPVVEIAFNGPLTRARLVVIGGAVALGILIAIAVASLRSGPIGAPVAVLTVCVVLLLWLRALRARALRVATEAGQAALRGDADHEIRAAIPRLAGSAAGAALTRLAEELARGGRGGLVVRIAPAGDGAPLIPIDVAFEPRPLDQLGAALLAAGADADIESLGTAPTIGANVRRNVLLKGGLVFVVIFVINIAREAFRSLETRRVTTGLLLWCALLAVLLFLPASSAWYAGRQWLLVPGGLVRRTSSWFRGGWQVHVFDRSRSVALLFRNWRKSWGLAVADTETSGLMIGTRQELEFALRAWLSPLAPPPVERLSDLG